MGYSKRLAFEMLKQERKNLSKQIRNIMKGN